MSPEFLLVTFIVVASPGTGAIYTLSAGLGQGPRAALLAAFACTLGIVPHLAAAMLGLAALLHASALAYETVKYAGVAYLLFMAWQSLRARGALNVDGERRVRRPLKVIADGILLNLLNPKLSIFFVSFLPQFIAAGEARPLLRMLELSSVFMGLTFVVFAFYGLFAAAVRERIVNRPAIMAWLRRSFAAAFVALGVKLALTER
ncbi:LysE family translocator [Ancylobacter pratisalsi]|uniref:LysE family translocator n=1 Tax=Ancylobacter pratisalsi TaxID=1745854 RepID=A0A6P1YIU8_9HYPH|nr:LysE family translocator [Ancylobacter pratisalsi]QIB32591.1 LysE family translocator [Ancylobacter pratisalsi]